MYTHSFGYGFLSIFQFTWFCRTCTRPECRHSIFNYRSIIAYYYYNDYTHYTREKKMIIIWVKRRYLTHCCERLRVHSANISRDHDEYAFRYRGIRRDDWRTVTNVGPVVEAPGGSKRPRAWCVFAAAKDAIGKARETRCGWSSSRRAVFSRTTTEQFGARVSSLIFFFFFNGF